MGVLEFHRLWIKLRRGPKDGHEVEGEAQGKIPQQLEIVEDGVIHMYWLTRVETGKGPDGRTVTTYVHLGG